MYTTDEKDRQEQKKKAQATIADIAKRYRSKKKRLAELEWWRSIYQSSGQQDAIDVLEEQMRDWGRKEQESNIELLRHYDAELKKRGVPYGKEEWEEEDQQICGSAIAYSEARYAVRFLDVMTARDYLSERCRFALDWLDGPTCSPEEGIRARTEVAVLTTIIHQMTEKASQTEKTVLIEPVARTAS